MTRFNRQCYSVLLFKIDQYCRIRKERHKTWKKKKKKKKKKCLFWEDLLKIRVVDWNTCILLLLWLCVLTFVWYIHIFSNHMWLIHFYDFRITWSTSSNMNFGGWCLLQCLCTWMFAFTYVQDSYLVQWVCLYKFVQHSVGRTISRDSAPPSPTLPPPPPTPPFVTLCTNVYKCYCICKKKGKRKVTITNRSPSQTPRGRGNRQIQTSTNRTNVRKALRLALSSPSEVIAILKGLKNTRTKWHTERHTTNRLVE